MFYNGSNNIMGRPKGSGNKKLKQGIKKQGESKVNALDFMALKPGYKGMIRLR